MKLKYLLLSLLFVSCSFANGLLCSAAGDVNLTSITNWNCTPIAGGSTTHVVPGDGDYTYIPSGDTLSINANWGTVSNGIQTVRINGTVTIDNTASRTILFASTGGPTSTDLIGSGSITNPGTDAAIQMFFLVGNSSALNLVGTAAHPVTIAAADGSSQWSISERWGGVVGCTSLSTSGCAGASASFSHSSLSMSYVKSQGQYDIFMNNQDAGGDVSILHSQFTSPMYVYGTGNAIFNGPGATCEIQYNTITGRRGINSFYFYNENTATAFTFTDNTEYNNSAAGYLLAGLFSPNVPGILSRNFVYSPSGNLGLYGFPAGVNSGTIVSTSDDVALMDAPGKLDGFINMLPAQVTGMTSYGVAAATKSEGNNNWMLAFNSGINAQGTIINFGGAGGVTSYNNHHNIFVQPPEVGLGGNILLFTFTSTGTANAAVPTMTHNTAYSTTNTQSGVTDGNFFLGEGVHGSTFGVTNGLVKDNISMFNWFGIASLNPDNTFLSDFAGAGVHHNTVFGQANAAYTNIGAVAHFDDGTHSHPDAMYGDLAVDPILADPSRTPATFDSIILGGPGTFADLAVQMDRSGLSTCTTCGTYKDGAIGVSGMTITQYMRAWLFAGFRPTNLALWHSASDGTTQGAVEMWKPEPVMGWF